MVTHKPIDHQKIGEKKRPTANLPSRVLTSTFYAKRNEDKIFERKLRIAVLWICLSSPIILSSLILSNFGQVVKNNVQFCPICQILSILFNLVHYVQFCPYCSILSILSNFVHIVQFFPYCPILSVLSILSNFNPYCPTMSNPRAFKLSILFFD